MAVLELRVDGVEAALSVRRFAIREGISELFDVAVVACSPRADLDLDDVVLRPASFSIVAGWAFVRGGGRRSYSGVCASIEQVHAEPTGLSTYSVRIAPQAWLLTLNRDYRIFQHVSIPDIVARILEGMPHRVLNFAQQRRRDLILRNLSFFHHLCSTRT